MNERNLYDDEFERLLKEKADQFKMYPSDRVWNGVNNSLHTKRRRYIAGMTILIGGFLVIAGLQLISASRHGSASSVAVVSKTSTKLNPASDAQNADGAGFVGSSMQKTRNHRNSDPSLISSAAFALPEFIPSESAAGSDLERESGNEKMQTVVVNTVQATSTAINTKPVVALSVPALIDNEQAKVNLQAENRATEDLSPEKSVTHLTRNRNDRFSWEIYITPTLNTRYLTGMSQQTMRQALQNAPIMVVRFANVNGYIDNTPAMGYNIGGSFLYRLSDNISLKAGVEFSYSRYYIKAYNSAPSQNSPSLSPYLGYIPDSLPVNNNGGNGLGIDKNPRHYQNKYYQLSIPIGVEMKVAGSGKVQLHLGASIQPSYLLNTDSYVLSSDYSSYIKDAPVYRRWNLNAGAEAFISYGVGKIRWELGPQIRYQIFSTYKNSYPISENLLNYGIRIGFSKTIW